MQMCVDRSREIGEKNNHVLVYIMSEIKFPSGKYTHI